LPIHVSSYELAQIRRAAAADVLSLAVEVRDELGWQLNGDGAAVVGEGPVGHGVGSTATSIALVIRMQSIWVADPDQTY
jgi:threonine dehydrogenase-like Zn-dependent dehydrogenase